MIQKIILVDAVLSMWNHVVFVATTIPGYKLGQVGVSDLLYHQPAQTMTDEDDRHSSMPLKKSSQ